MVGATGAGTSAAAVTGPIGGAVWTWRLRRGLSPAELTERSGLPHDLVEDLEAGRTWVDRRRVWAALAAALHVEAGELAGQPYPPMGPEHAEARAVAHRLRKVLAADLRRPLDPTTGATDELERLLAAAVAADGAGDDHGLAVVAPELISAAERAERVTGSATRERTAELRSRAHAVVAGLLRRLGYRDLAWLVLHRVRAGGREGATAVAAEETRLLLDLGLPEQALGCAERSGLAPRSVEMSVLVALAHAMAGRPERAGTELDAATGLARDPCSFAAVAAARVAVAVEAPDADVASGYAELSGPDALPGLDALDPADRVAALVSLAASAARAGDFSRAADELMAAEVTAPLRFRLDPFARELLVALPPRLAERERAEHVRVERVRATARRAGLP
ncbi:helix-turn-helix transcriptional regulator [Actinacidiphila sp. ITFR-21]|uniref:helix-turn-helix transcriptional regulator n=1 Tax=Actinacidiphila sp. ITFR-21 TaxID=3075199 RepID=UPI0028890A14|nr:helix-turn-helix transcriptional regulator [Streptomyces sp. ITFR-21]WNI16861.1 helix-turn-helix transcriptional regulator [Streptomyces sp. ITFR-21]